MDEVRAGVPSRDVQLDQALARYSEGGDVFNARSRVLAEIAGWSHADQPLLAAERAQALCDPPMSCDPGKAESDMRQVHNPEPRFAIAQDEFRLARRRLRVVAGVGALAARFQRRDDLAVGCKR